MDTHYNHPLLIAGPCSAESREQVLETASALAKLGVKYFRAGVWKARTSPGCFEGIGAPAIEWLVEVRERFGMLIGTEVASPEHARLALDAKLDFLWIGARTSSNPFVVEQIASSMSGIPPTTLVLVKNPIAPSLKLWQGAINRMRDHGITNLAALHRGFDIGQHPYYRNSPLWHLALELRQAEPSLPLLFDPSHVAGESKYVPDLALQALQRWCYDGLMIESHIHPTEALSDAKQQLTPNEIGKLLESITALPRVAKTELGESLLEDYRSQIDQIDEEIIRLLGKRRELSKQIGKVKEQSGQSALQLDRYKEVLQNRAELAKIYGTTPQMVQELYELIHEDSVQAQSHPKEADLDED
ncbi:MAG: chorismate mutase [Porphyromonas sp.]|nr:chorismate mutase [Porphyromonas sp.]